MTKIIIVDFFLEIVIVIKYDYHNLYRMNDVLNSFILLIDVNYTFFGFFFN